MQKITAVATEEARLDLLAAPFSLIPFGFFVLLTASMGGSAAALLIYGGIGLARALLP